MIIRDYIKRRVWACMAVAVGGWLLVPLSAAALGDKPNPLFMMAGPVLFGGAILAMYWAVRCPKCKARLAQTVGMATAFQWGSRAKVNFCPYCGVSLDEPVPDAQPVAHPQNPIR
jgi:hypothetical protein